MNVARHLLLASVLLGANAGTAEGQTSYEACYVPDVGAIYLVNLPGLPAACLAPSHVAVSWTDGGSLAAGSVTALELADGAVVTPKMADGAVTEAKLGFDPASQPELDAAMAGLAASGTINAAGNPLDWTRLKNVPAGLADGVDDGGGVSGDLDCSGCVDDADVAPRALSAGKLAFDPATQVELDAALAALANAGTVNRTTNPVDWSQLKSVPPDFADGVDDRGPTAHSLLTGLIGDDHPQYLLANTVRATTSGFAVTGTLGSGGIPASGAGVRLMWYPRKAAFRAGRVDQTQWEDANIGDYSMGLGYGTTASGDVSTALGRSSTASGDISLAAGAYTQATGPFSAAMGDGSIASGVASFALGNGAVASGANTTALGEATATAYASVAIGRWNVVTGDEQFWVPGNPLLVAGNGSGSGSRSNALTLYKNGNLTIAGTLTQSSDIRLKEEVERVESTLAGVLRLTPIRYRFRDGTGHPTDPRIGLSAQEVREVFPELVEEDAQGYLGVAYTELAAVLVRAVQEQQAQIEALRRTIDRLRSGEGGAPAR